MTRFNLGTLHNASAWTVYRMREQIRMDPVYQRQGDIWDREKQQLLIDTMINGFDVPKLYVHKYRSPQVEGDRTYDYAMIDGKQRVQAIFGFIENRFALDNRFAYLRDPSVQLSTLTYRELATQHPEIKADFDSYGLDIITIEADDIELIEDLFSRLNEAMPLNAAEKRNAKPGPLPRLVRELTLHAFFTEKLPFGNSRYRHFDIMAKMLLMADREAVADIKKAYLDRFFENHTESTPADVAGYGQIVKDVLNAMNGVFTDRDPLLRSVGMISLYFLLFERALETGKLDRLRRAELSRFEDERQANRREAEDNISEANYRFLEFDRYAQSPNDGIALRYRLAVIDDHLFGGDMGFADDNVLGAD